MGRKVWGCMKINELEIELNKARKLHTETLIKELQNRAKREGWHITIKIED